MGIQGINQVLSFLPSCQLTEIKISDLPKHDGAYLTVSSQSNMRHCCTNAVVVLKLTAYADSPIHGDRFVLHLERFTKIETLELEVGRDFEQAEDDIAFLKSTIQTWNSFTFFSCFTLAISHGKSLCLEPRETSFW